jgi:small conductance mechanosensitive channel
MDYFENIKKSITNKIPNFVGSLFIFLLFLIIANIVKNYIIKPDVFDETNYESKSLIQHQIGSFIYYIIFTIGMVFAVINLGFDMTTIITILASIGLALGIAMQGTLSNVISGIIISINNMFNINDIIKINQLINDHSTYGKIIDFNLYYTTIYNPVEKSLINIPNSTIQNNLITNITRSKLLIKK